MLNARCNRCQEDLNSFPLGELEETLHYVDEDPARPEIQQPVPEPTWLRIIHSGD